MPTHAERTSLVSVTTSALTRFGVAALAGAVGAVVRFEIWQWHDTQKWLLVSTFGINAFGCLVLGAGIGYLSGREAPVLRAALLGAATGFTTFSFYALQGVTYVAAWNSVVYLIATPIVCIAATAVGALITRPPRRVS